MPIVQNYPSSFVGAPLLRQAQHRLGAITHIAAGSRSYLIDYFLEASWFFLLGYINVQYSFLPYGQPVFIPVVRTTGYSTGIVNKLRYTAY